MNQVHASDQPQPHVVIVGAGFAGLAAARRLASENLKLTIVDRRSYHLFTPLLYQVATGSLSPSEIAIPIRVLFRNKKNVNTLMGRVADLHLHESAIELADGQRLHYDYLVLAAGAQSHYFGNEDEWADRIFTLDDLESAERLRDRFLSLCERAEWEDNPQRRRSLLTFGIIGGGPSGVELAGALSDIMRSTLSPAYRRVKPEDVRVVLFEAEDQILTSFPSQLSEFAQKQLQEMGVDVRTGCPIEDVKEGVIFSKNERLECGMICWGGGVRPAKLCARINAPQEADGVVVDDYCTVDGRRNVFSVGDMAHLEMDGQPLPGLAAVALQQGNHVADCVVRDLQGRKRLKFSYNDKGIMATLGASQAVVDFGPLKVKGRPAWLLWVALHIWYLVGFRTRLLVVTEWAASYLGLRNGNRIIRSEAKSNASLTDR